MMPISKRKRRIVVSILIPVLIATSFVYPIANRGTENASGNDHSIGDSDIRIAADISNMTGVEAEEIIRLKETGISWNEVLERVQGKAGTSKKSRKTRNSVLTAANMEDTVAKLKDSGYSDRQIQTARLFAERVEFQFREIARDEKSTGSFSMPVKEPADPFKKEDLRLEALQNVAGKYDAVSAVYYLLVLEQVFHDQTVIMDEYLLSLQLELDLKEYIDDPDAYLKSKQEKLAGLTPDLLVTAGFLEESLLSRMNRHSLESSGKEDSAIPQPSGTGTPLPGDSIVSRPADFALPEAPHVQPVNPGDQIKEELDSLNPNLP
ncbi:hypothetical protein [Paenibacillus sanfengchensis]|uniref:hypothetical protein n=1 Tax=Paenibacillus sanfengchensis TaxID=3119819 RepID=UPI002FE0620E